MQNTNIIGLDLAKSVFQLSVLDHRGNEIKKKQLKRAQVLPFLAKQPTSVVAMEACSGSHYWARQLAKLGHTVKVIHPRYVKPFVQVNKNDTRDALGIAEAASRPTMPTVAVKNVEQQDLQALHRVRERIVKERVAVGNELRGLLAEYGVIRPKGAKAIREQVLLVLEDGTNELSVRGRRMIADLRQQWLQREQQEQQYAKEIAQIANSNETCKRLQSIPGIGPIISTLLYSHIGKAASFASGRHVSASLGLVPRQHSSGGKDVLLGISKQGNKQIRKMLVHGARSAYKSLQRQEKDSALKQWVMKHEGKKHPNVIIVALANKLARISWALMKNGSVYHS
ncbi:IS110 family transposase [Reinekea marina]|uniref:IS110 family transposase n=1 Tax=Reinekea marina TaxID=1310421 RepID=UPI0025B3A9F5|nr:IS110 family transposase [Reinekea marina]MDN3650678.1 IS110 family transposase [Reinekea marina]